MHKRTFACTIPSQTKLILKCVLTREHVCFLRFEKQDFFKKNECEDDNTLKLDVFKNKNRFFVA